jgi:hypothetical protein
MLETIASGLIVAGATGATVVAYRDAETFQRIHILVHVVAISVALLATAYNVGIHYAWTVVMEALPIGQIPANLDRMFDDIKISGWVIFGAIGAMAYVGLLAVLFGHRHQVPSIPPESN